MTDIAPVRLSVVPLLAGDTALPVEVVNTVRAIALAPTAAAAARVFDDSYEGLPETYRAKLRHGVAHALHAAVRLDAPEPAR